MHRAPSNSTMPSGRWNIAAVGQIGTHGGFAQWLHRVTWKKRRTCGNAPFSTYLTHVRLTPRGTLFSALHAVEQAWQPMHRRLSMTKAKPIRERSLRRSLDFHGESRLQRQAQPRQAARPPFALDPRGQPFPDPRRHVLRGGRNVLEIVDVLVQILVI